MKKLKLAAEAKKDEPLEKILFKKGTVLKFGGMPFSLPQDTYLLGRMENYKYALGYVGGREGYKLDLNQSDLSLSKPVQEASVPNA